MARLHFVKSARKDNPVAKKGESYYWWQFAFGKKQFSKEKPPRSRLTQSSYFATVWDIQDNFSIGKESMEDDVQGLIDDLNNLLDECQNSLDNMPEHLQDSSDAGQTLTERIDALTDCISSLESIDLEDADLESVEDEVQSYIGEL